MQSILHNWSDAECKRILRNCRTAMAKKGKVVIVEHVLLDTPKSGVSNYVEIIDMFMLAYNPGAKERTEKEFRSLAKEAGFQGLRKVCTADALCLMELYD